MSISLGTYRIIRIVASMVIAGTVSYGVVTDNMLWPVLAVTLGIVVLVIARNAVKEVTADERDYALAGHAARWAMQVFSALGVLTMFILLWQRAANPMFETIAYVLSYAICALMLLYSLFYYYQQARLGTNRALWSVVFVVAALIGFAIVGLRLFGGEDDWICENGQWVEHGHPDSAMPTSECLLKK
jgi:uncharacterized membrane protein